MASLCKSSPSSIGHSACTHRPFVSARQLVRPRQLHIARVSSVTDETFAADVLQSDKPVVVDFWATWCGPCKLVAPLMDWADKEYKGAIKVVKAEHDANPKLIEEFKVYGLPALLLIKDGKLVPGSKREGALTKALFIKWLKDNGIEQPTA